MYILLILLLLLSCTKNDGQNSKDPSIITTLFPIYDFARVVGGDLVEVSLIIPPGVEPHSYEPSPRDMRQLQKADLFIYLGSSMEPWAESISRNRRGSQSVSLMDSIDIEKIIGKKAPEHECNSSHTHSNCSPSCTHSHTTTSTDPHIWLDPLLAIEMVSTIERSLIKTLPEHSETFSKRADSLRKELLDLHTFGDSLLSDCRVRTLVYGGHFAFAYFINRYDLDYSSPYRGFSPNAEPTPRALQSVIQTVDSIEVEILFIEELVQPRVAKVISEETGVELQVLHSLHNISRSDKLGNFSYLSVMKDNFVKLAKGLDCQ